MTARCTTGFRQDLEQDWIADLECGHSQHVRHDPPWQVRPWVTTAEGRREQIGTTLECRLCLEADAEYDDARIRGLCEDGAREIIRNKSITK